jgi:hypothetical protein
MFVGVLSFIVNVFLVAFTWRLVRNTKDTAQRQLRAYVSVSVERHPDIQSNQPLTAILILKNSGLTPAYVVSVWARMGLRPYPGEDKDFERLSEYEKAAAMANHTSTRTTQLYDRRHDEMSLDEVERIGI